MWLSRVIQSLEWVFVAIYLRSALTTASRGVINQSLSCQQPTTLIVHLTIYLYPHDITRRVWVVVVWVENIPVLRPTAVEKEGTFARHM